MCHTKLWNMSILSKNNVSFQKAILAHGGGQMATRILDEAVSFRKIGKKQHAEICS